MRLSYANVVSSLALFLALGGVGYAATQLEDNSVRSRHIVDGQVQTADLSASAKPTPAYFRFRDADRPAKVVTDRAQVEKVIALALPTGRYRVSGSVLVEAPTGTEQAMVCQLSQGAGPTARLFDVAWDMRRLPGAPGEGAGRMKLALDGVTNGVMPAGDLVLSCGSFAGGATIYDAKVSAHLVRSLQISQEP